MLNKFLKNAVFVFILIDAPTIDLLETVALHFITQHNILTIPILNSVLQCWVLQGGATFCKISLMNTCLNDFTLSKCTHSIVEQAAASHSCLISASFLCLHYDKATVHIIR